MKLGLCKLVPAKIERKKKENLLAPTMEINHSGRESRRHLWEILETPNPEINEEIKSEQHNRKQKWVTMLSEFSLKNQRLRTLRFLRH